MIYLFIIACICVQVFVQDPIMLGITNESLLHCFSYQFAHSNWLHLGINVFCLAYMFKPIHNLYNMRFGYTKGFLIFLACYLSSSMSGLMTAQSSPTVGASGMVFFLLGMLLSLAPNKQTLKSMIWVALSLIVGFFLGNIAIWLHIVCFILGALFVFIRLVYDNRGLSFLK